MVIISSILIGVHFFRWGYYTLVIISLLCPAILAMRTIWAKRAVQVFLIVSSIEWVRIILIFVTERQRAGMAWTKLAVILGTVAAFTMLSAIMIGVEKKQIKS